MQFYLVAKSPNGSFVGTRTAHEIIKLFHAGEILAHYVVTPSYGPSYQETVKKGTAVWTQISDFVDAALTAADQPTVTEDRSKGRAAFTTPPPRREVVITNIDMPFETIVVFMVKWAFASIPAFFILFIAGLLLAAIFGFLTKMMF